MKDIFSDLRRVSWHVSTSFQLKKNGKEPKAGVEVTLKNVSYKTKVGAQSEEVHATILCFRKDMHYFSLSRFANVQPHLDGTKAFTFWFGIPEMKSLQ